VGIHVIPAFYSGSPSANNGMFSAYNRNGILLQRRFDIALFAFSEAPDPQQQETSFDPSLIPSASKPGAANQNYTGITDRDQFALLEQARRTLDTAERKALFYKWQHLVNERVYFIMLYARSNITADNGKIGHYWPNPSQEGNSWNAYEWYRAD
jgi:ABC-type transport system substrate-binding protein